MIWSQDFKFSIILSQNSIQTLKKGRGQIQNLQFVRVGYQNTGNLTLRFEIHYWYGSKPRENEVGGREVKIQNWQHFQVWYQNTGNLYLWFWIRCWYLHSSKPPNKPRRGRDKIQHHFVGYNYHQCKFNLNQVCTVCCKIRSFIFSNFNQTNRWRSSERFHQGKSDHLLCESMNFIQNASGS